MVTNEHIVKRLGQLGYTATDEDSAIIDFELEKILNYVMNYCNITEIPDISVGARYHHERYDGKGYPDGLKGEEIPISAQVVSLADVYDALVSDRVYKKAYSHEKTMEMILNGECGIFNPLLLECLVEVQDKVRKELGIKGVNECLEYLEERN